MAKIDRLLLQLTTPSADSLRLVPGLPPQVHMASGKAVNLVASPLPSAVVDALAAEIIPPHLASDLDASQGLSFLHEADGNCYHISARRIRGDIHLDSRLRLRETSPPVRIAPEPLGVRPIVQECVPGFHPFFRMLMDRGGSDLHWMTGKVPSMRLHGELVPMEGGWIPTRVQMETMLAELTPPALWERFRSTNDLDFAYLFEERDCRLRTNYFQTQRGPGMVARLIPHRIPTPEQIDLPRRVIKLTSLTRGLVLVTGPTGSGKSTTLASLVDVANRTRQDHIITIEDPIEFVHTDKGCLVDQREVGTHTASFKSGLRAALREDPDIILVGEMRDLETIAMAMETAITGHLVFATLHTTSAVATIDRIIDQFPADRQAQVRTMLADSLKAVVSQNLVKRIGGGRVAARETLFITPAIANLIREGKSFQIPSSMQTGRGHGQMLLNDVLVDLVKARTIDTQEAYRCSPDREAYIAACRKHGLAFDLTRMEEAD